jgi:hypothetical protein
MSTQTEVKSTESTESTAAAEVKTEAQAILSDATIVSDKVFIKLMAQVDNHQLKVGGKWAELIEHCIKVYHFQGIAESDKENKELVAANQKEVTAGKKVVLKTLLEMGKTESSAYSIRSYIIKMSKAENAETLAKLKAGDITVRASREAGRRPQSNPGLSNEEKYRRALNDAVRYAIALGYTGAMGSSRFGDEAQTAFNEYLAAQEAKKA